MNEEIMVNATEEVAIEAAEEQMVKGSGNGWKYGIAIAAGVGLSYILYKKVIKPGINKIKAKRDAKKAQQEEVTYEVYDTEDFKLD